MSKIIRLDDIVKQREERETKEFQDKIEGGINEMMSRLKKIREREKKNKPLSKKVIPFIAKAIGISFLVLILLSIAAVIKLLIVWLF